VNEMTGSGSRPRILILAGPNGAGKTTFAREYLPNEAACPIFVNADLIAAGLSPFDPDAAAMRAGRIMLAEIRANVATRRDFAFETTLSGKAYARMIPGWRLDGYHVELVFLRLETAEIAIDRVRERVRQGGHSIPDHTIRRRFVAGIRNFEAVYKPLVDGWVLYDNSGNVPAILERGSLT